jgi:hypothetical protein
MPDQSHQACAGATFAAPVFGPCTASTTSAMLKASSAEIVSSL